MWTNLIYQIQIQNFIVIKQYSLWQLYKNLPLTCSVYLVIMAVNIPNIKPTAIPPKLTTKNANIPRNTWNK